MIYSALSLGCVEQGLVTAPEPLAAPVVPRSTMSALPSFSAYLSAPGGSSIALTTYDFPEGVLVGYSVSGNIRITSSSNASYFHEDTANVDAGGVPVWGVYNGACFAAVRISYSGGPTNFGGLSCNPWGTSRVSTGQGVVRGTGTVTRTANIPVYYPGPCSFEVCHTYAGAQTVTITPVAGAQDLFAFLVSQSMTARKGLFVPPFISSYQRVIFTDSSTPRNLPLRPLSRSWAQADPTLASSQWGPTIIPPWCNGDPNAVPPPSVSCSVWLYETGTYESRVRVNGVEHTDSVTIYCADTEPLLNNHLVRQQMLAALDSSHADNPDPLQRSERYFLILRDTVTPGAEPYLQIYPHLPTDDVCGAAAFIPSLAALPANTRILAHGHTHPSEPNITVMCRDSSGAATIPATTVDGASVFDRAWASRVNDPTGNPLANTGWLPMPGFIIDKHNVFVQRPGAAPGAERAAGNIFNWDGLPPIAAGLSLRCRWPKKVV